MENLSHSGRQNITLSKKSYNGTTTNFAAAAAGSKSMYDVFGGPPRFGAPALSPRVEDYAEIFGGFQATRATSIPMLDLPLVEEGSHQFFDVRSSGFDYGEVFGGFECSDFAVSYEELMRMDQSSRCGGSSDSDEAWTPDANYASQESNHSVKNHLFSSGDSYELIDDSMEFNILYHKASRINGDMSNGITHFVPGYTSVVDQTTSLSKTENDLPHVHASDYGHINIDFNKETMTERHLRKTMSHPTNGHAGGLLYGNDARPHRRYVRNGSLPVETFVTISDLSLKTRPSQVPPPSRLPPALDVKKRESNKTTPSCQSFASEENVDDGFPPYFDIEVDASSSAAASAAAMEEAMEKAQAKLKNAKELMERKREGLQSHTRVGSMNERKTKEEVVTMIVNGPDIRKDERVHVTGESKENGMEIPHLEGRQKVSKTTHISDSLERKKHKNMAKRSAVERNGRESLSSQGSGEIDGAAEWKEATQFFELVRTDKSRKALDQANNECRLVKNTTIPEHGKKEEKIAMEALQQNQDNGKKATAVGADHNFGEYDKKLEISKEAYKLAGNNGRSEASTLRHKQKGLEKKVHAAHVASRQEENDKNFRMDWQPVETVKSKNKVDGSQKHESTVNVQLKERKFEVELTINHKEKDRHPKEANRSGADEKRFGCERDNTEQTRRETLEPEENEKRSKKPQSQVENEKKKDAYQREEEYSKLWEDFEQKENEKRLKEALEKEESERRLKEALEKEENERKQRDAVEWEENEKRLKEGCAREENEKRVKEAREREENQRKLKEAREKEENERRLKAAAEQEENEKRQREAHEREENQRILKEALEKEEHERSIQAVVQQEENEKRQKENVQNDENENNLKHAVKQEEIEKKQKENLEQQESKKEKEASAREETYKRDKEAFRETQIDKIFKEGLEKEEVGKTLHEGCEQEESWQTSAEAYGEVTKTGLKEAHEPDETGGISQQTNEWPGCRTKVKDAHPNVPNQCQLNGNNNLQATGLPGRHEGGGEKLQATEKISHEEMTRIPAEPTSNKKDVVVDAVNLMSDGKVDVSCEDKSLKSSGEVELGIAQRNFAKVKSALLTNSRIEVQGKKHTHEIGERGKFNKQPQVTLSQEDNRDNFTSAKVMKELTEIGRKVESAELATFEVKGSSQKTTQQVNRSQVTECKVNHVNGTLSSEEKEPERLNREKEMEKERLRKMEEEMEREREREKDRMAVDRATLEACDRAYAEARERAERVAVERAMNEARERLEKACAGAREKSLADKMSTEARLRAERAAVERAAAEARERAFGKATAERAAFEARERVERSVSDKFSASSRNNGIRPSSSLSDLQDLQSQNASSSDGSRYPYSSVYAERSEGVEGESAQRCKARLERHRRTAERAAKALAEKNMRDLLAQREQAERNRLAESLGADVKRWSSGKEGNLRALLSTLQYILGPDSGWQPIPLTEVITSAAVKKAYRKATLCVHPDKLQQRGASIQQKYICEKVFDLLKEAWNKFNSEER